MLTGRQIREARKLLGLDRSVLAQKVGRITTLAIMRAEEHEDEPTLSPEQDALVRQTLERLGVEVGPDGVRLQKP
jgi:ribosome-binding protein aMBF1 (putative translation factor)